MQKKEKIMQMKNLKSKKAIWLPEDLDIDSQKTVYFGTGLASSSEPSLGFGIDLLSTILTSLKVKRELGANKVIHLISTTGYNIDEVTRDQLLARQKEEIETIIENLGISDEYRLLLSSEFINTPEFERIYRETAKQFSGFEDTENFDSFGPYTILQTALSKYLYEQEKARVKIGWTVKDSDRPDRVSIGRAQELVERGKLNEFYFDEMYRYAFPEDSWGFVYTPPALTLDGKCTPPYTVTIVDNRPLLSEDVCTYYKNYMERMKSTPSSRKKLRQAIKNWNETIIEPYEELFGPIEIRESTHEEVDILMKLSAIQQQILRRKEFGTQGIGIKRNIEDMEKE